MPECPTCCKEFDYDGMMAHDGGECRRRARAFLVAAITYRHAYREAEPARHNARVSLFATLDVLRPDLTS